MAEGCSELERQEKEAVGIHHHRSGSRLPLRGHHAHPRICAEMLIPSGAVSRAFFSDEGDGGQLLSPLWCLSSTPLETEVSMHRVGLGRWLSCPSPPCPTCRCSTSVLPEVAAPRPWGTRQRGFAFHGAGTSLHRSGLCFQALFELFTIPTGAKPQAGAHSPAPSPHRGLPLRQRGQSLTVFAFNFFLNDARDCCIFLVFNITQLQLGTGGGC